MDKKNEKKVVSGIVTRRVGSLREILLEECGKGYTLPTTAIRDDQENGRETIKDYVLGISGAKSVRTLGFYGYLNGKNTPHRESYKIKVSYDQTREESTKRRVKWFEYTKALKHNSDKKGNPPPIDKGTLRTIEHLLKEDKIYS